MILSQEWKEALWDRHRGYVCSCVFIEDQTHNEHKFPMLNIICEFSRACQASFAGATAMERPKTPLSGDQSGAGKSAVLAMAQSG